MALELNFGYYFELTLNLTEFMRMSKSEMDLEFWQWIWKAKYIHLG